MTPDELILRIKQHTGNRTSAGPTLVIDDDWYAARLNDGYKHVATFQGMVSRPGIRQPQFRVLRFVELEDRIERTINSGLSDNFIANSTGVFAVYGLWDQTNKRPIRIRSKRRLMEKDPTDSGDIQIWAPMGDGGVAGYRIWKVPDASTTIHEHVYNYPETLTAGGSDPVIPENWHEAVHLAGGMIACGLLQMDDQSARLQTELHTMIATHRTPVEEARTGGGRYSFVGRRFVRR